MNRFIAAGIALLQPSFVAYAHSGTHSYAIVDIKGSVVTGTVQFPVDDLNDVLGLAIPRNAAGATNALAANADAIEQYLGAHFSVADSSGAWPIRFTGTRVLERSKFTYAIFEYVVDPALAVVPRRFTVSYNGIVATKPAHEGLTIVRSYAGFGSLRTKHEQRLPVSADKTEHHVVIEDSNVSNDLAGATEHIGAQAKEYLRRTRKRLRGSSR